MDKGYQNLAWLLIKFSVTWLASKNSASITNKLNTFLGSHLHFKRHKYTNNLTHSADNHGANDALSTSEET